MDGSVATTDQFKLVGLPFWWTVSISISDASLIYKNISCLATPVFFTNDFQHIPLSLWTCFQSVFRSRSRVLFLSLNRWFAHPPLRIMLSANRHGSTDKLFLQATIFYTKQWTKHHRSKYSLCDFTSKAQEFWDAIYGDWRICTVSFPMIRMNCIF